jgi:hypothetical protein
MRWKSERWVKLYTKEDGSFATLGATTRAYAALFLKLVDASGFIATGRHADVATSIAFQLGADQGDRRIIRRAVSELISDGYLAPVQGGVLVRNFALAQGQKKDSDRRESGASPARAEREPGLSPARAEREPGSKNDLSSENERENAPVDKIRIEEKRIEKEEEKTETRPSRFDLFWESYPKKTAKSTAVSAWRKACKSVGGEEKLFTMAMPAVEWQRRSRSWLDGYVPNPATWLNGGRWDDKPPASLKSAQASMMTVRRHENNVPPGAEIE